MTPPIGDNKKDPHEGPKRSSLLKAISNPVKFATKNDFHNLHSVRGLEGTITTISKELLLLDLPGDEKGDLTSLIDLFKGFDSASQEEKKETLTKAGLILDSLLKVKGEGSVEEAPVSMAGSGSYRETKAEKETPPIPAPSTSPLTSNELHASLDRLGSPLTSIKGIGPKVMALFNSKGVETVEDLLYYLPIWYEDRRNLLKIRDLTPGDGAVFSGEVQAAGEVRYGRRRGFEAVIGDGTGLIKLKWFNFKGTYMSSRYKPGRGVTVYGTPSIYGGALEIIHPDVELAPAKGEGSGDDGGEEGGEDIRSIAPVYSQVANLHQKTIRKYLSAALSDFAGSMVGAVPGHILREEGLPGLTSAIRAIHNPEDLERGITPALAQRSIVFDDLFALEVGLELKRLAVEGEEGIRLKAEGRYTERLLDLLPFTLTGAQRSVLDNIYSDLERGTPMHRLIQGDVGSGKTIVSYIALLQAIEGGFQGALMAPTEILAEQHYLSTKGYSERLGIRSVLLTGSIKGAEKKRILEEIKRGEVDLIIGTHALIQKDVEFKRLGLGVIDEQHRFGVVQRGVLRRKGIESEAALPPHILVMTATPIPRTLAMTFFGDLQVSVIEELPPGRIPIKTAILREKEREKAYRMIRDELGKGHQAYIVYPLIEESEELDLKDATKMHEHLDKDIFPDHRVTLLHGRMKGTEKEEIMRDFKDGGSDVLVSTTVIEVGVDVPNATLMMIEHAERFGLAQLHQLRGRVGRGGGQSTCILLAQWTNSDDTLKRLRIMEATEDGFRIAEEDFKIRGPGDFLGARQSGFPDFRTKEALTDLNLLKRVRGLAARYLEEDPDLTGPWGETIREVLKKRWAGRLELAKIG